MTHYGESEQEKFYRHANTAATIGTAVLVGSLFRPKGPQPPLPHAAKVWWSVMGGFFALAAVAWFMEAASQSTDDYVHQQNPPSHVWSIIFLVLAVLCFFIGLIAGALDPMYTPPTPPRAATPAPAAPTPPPGPQPTETRVERSVRVVRARGATTTHHNYKRAPGPTQSPDNDVVPRKQLVIVTGRPRRPTLHTELQHGNRIEDHRSFDRDIEP